MRGGGGRAGRRGYGPRPRSVFVVRPGVRPTWRRSAARSAGRGRALPRRLREGGLPRTRVFIVRGRTQPPPLFMSPRASARTPAWAAPAFKPKPCSAQLPLRDSSGSFLHAPRCNLVCMPGAAADRPFLERYRLCLPWQKSHTCAFGKRGHVADLSKSWNP